jgi:hypothetical protein
MRLSVYAVPDAVSDAVSNGGVFILLLEGSGGRETESRSFRIQEGPGEPFPSPFRPACMLAQRDFENAPGLHPGCDRIL